MDNMKILIEYVKVVQQDVLNVTMLEHVTLVIVDHTSRLELILVFIRNVILKTAQCVKMPLLKTRFVKYAVKDSS